MVESLLEVRDLVASYATRGGPLRAVDGVSFRVAASESLGLVGESGCGKSSVARAILGVFPPTFRRESGEILFRGRDLARLGEEAMRRVRWKEIALVPQSAMNALNPVYPVGYQIAETIHAHERLTAREADERVKALLLMVGIEPERRKAYPHQLSGGMRQRVNIALALALDPALLIADEPTTALDVVLQNQIFGRLSELRCRSKAALLLITHDLGLVARNCDWTAVMYAGRIAESAATRRVLSEPFHPYTLGLMNAFPRLDRPRGEPLISIPKSPPSLAGPLPGCRFAPRCPFATDRCREEEPALREVVAKHYAACHHLDRVDEMRERAKRFETWEAIR